MRKANYSSYSRRKQKAASELGRRMAAARWLQDRKRRDALAEMDPVKYTGRIIRRIIVIENEITVKEAVIYDFDSARSAKRKIATAMKNSLQPLPQ